MGAGAPLLDPLLAVEEIDEFRAQAVVAGVVDHLQPLAGPGDGHLQHVADLGARAVGEHHDPIGEQHGLVNVVGDHHGGERVLIANLHQLLLQIAAGERIEGAKGFIKQ